VSAIRILADDLTGALDTAAAFAGEVPVFIDTPPAPGEAYFASAVSVVATPTRDVAPDDLSILLQPVVDWLCSADLAYKKVDSLLRGNTFAEIAWLLGQGRFGGAVFAPAFPAQGRLTFDNRQWVAKPGQSLQAVASPLRESFAELQMRVQTSAENLGGRDVWIPEVRDDDDLDRVAAQSAATGQQHYLWCGSAGLAHALARRKCLAPVGGAALPLPAGSGPSVLISASFQPVLYAQWEALKDALPTPAIAERARREEIDLAASLAREGAPHARFDLSPRREMTPDESMALLQQNIRRLVDGLPQPGQLLIVGGDTLLAICRATGAQALLAGASIRAGWGCARLIGGVWDGVPCYSRSGAFGGADDLLMMIRLLSGSDNRRKGN
jgi:D-threonate/D-erythronate kinase